VVAFPPPPVTLRQRSSTFAEPLCSLRRVLASGCHPFLFEWLEKVSQPSLAEPFGSNQGVNRINSRLSHLSLGCHHPIADPCVGLKGRDRCDSVFILLLHSEIKFSGVLFCRDREFIFATSLSSPQRRFCCALPPFLHRLYISRAARKNLSNHLFCVAARCEHADAAHSD
jgi:hypothetical protein